MARSYLSDARSLISELADHESDVARELQAKFDSFVRVTDTALELASAMILVVGEVAPTSNQARTVRDLAADVFDFLPESTSLLIRGRPHLAYPMLRRCFESSCQLAACVLDAGYAGRLGVIHSLAKPW